MGVEVNMSQFTTKPTIRFVVPVQSDQSSHCTFYSLQDTQRGVKENTCQTG